MIRLDNVSREFDAGGGVRALAGVSLSIDAGERVALVGPSGSGKSTLLNLIGGLDRPTSGQVHVAGHNLALLDDDALSRVRGETIGFVFQFFNLLASLSAEENVALPLRLRGASRAEASTRAREALRAVGLGDRLTHLPDEMSGGQKQRVALARALVGAPRILLADEPTGNLDSTTGSEVLQLLDDTAAHTGLTMILVTHDDAVAARFPRRITMRDGRIEHDHR